MALFKVFRGPQEDLDTIPCYDGYSYFTEDSHKLFIDLGSGDAGVRAQVNAKGAESLMKLLEDGTVQYFTIDDIVLRDAIISIEQGGTGASNAVEARINLDVYSKQETDKAVTNAIAAVLRASDWSEASEGNYSYNLELANIRCGKDGNVPPVITYTSNKEDYDKILEAEATAGVGIEFIASARPGSDIDIIIIDLG